MGDLEEKIRWLGVKGMVKMPNMKNR